MKTSKQVKRSIRNKLNDEKTNIPCFNSKIPKSFWNKKK